MFAINLPLFKNEYPDKDEMELIRSFKKDERRIQ